MGTLIAFKFKKIQYSVYYPHGLLELFYLLLLFFNQGTSRCSNFHSLRYSHGPGIGVLTRLEDLYAQTAGGKTVIRSLSHCQARQSYQKKHWPMRSHLLFRMDSRQLAIKMRERGVGQEHKTVPKRGELVDFKDYTEET